MESSIVEYIKSNYPKVIFSPIKFKQSNAIGFIVSDGNLVIGYINSSGTLCKLVEPISLESLSEKGLKDIIRTLPIVEGFSEEDKINLIKLFEDIEPSKTQKDIDALLKAQSEQQNYKILYDNESGKIIAIKKEYEDKISQLQNQYNEKVKLIEESSKRLIQDKDDIIKALQDYKTNVENYVKSQDMELNDIKAMYKAILDEKNQLTKNLDTIVQTNQNNDELNNVVEDIKKELNITKEELKKSNLQRLQIERQRDTCKEMLLRDKTAILNKIEEYNRVWNNWLNNINEDEDFNKYKTMLIGDLENINKRLKTVLMSHAEDNALKQNIYDIERSLQKTIGDQIIQLNAKEEEIQMLKTKSESLESEMKQQNITISNLRSELERIGKLLLQNSNAKLETNINYESCYTVLQTFVTLNNIFFRKQEIINKLDDIIKTSTLNNLSENLREEIKEKFIKVKTEIELHITFMDLKKYVNSPNLQLLKSNATRNKVPESFCAELSNLLEYWEVNKAEFRKQDSILTNIYEDLSGAVRVYVRIKPLIGKEQKQKAISIQSVSEKKQKMVTLDCTKVANIVNNVKTTFGEFYGVFEETYSNADVFTGIENYSNSLTVDIDNIVDEANSISPGLYSAFKQVEDGYSIVLFGYGVSGAGKSYTLLGGNGVPGVLHYGLANLLNVQNIKLKYMFEQYVANVNINFAKIRGKIHSLVGQIPQLRKFSIDESKQLVLNVDVNNLSVSDLDILTNSVTKYREEMRRIKKTPNNPESSRSHLFMVFEITFGNGVKGYITIVDMGGRESPISIFNTFVDTNKTSLASVLSPAGGVPLIEKFKSRSDYGSRDILEILNEGIYINETINHLIYFFNKKNYKKTRVDLQSSDASKYNIKRYYVKPFEEESSINESNNCLTIPILTFLESLSKKSSDYKPTKFIMMCMVRQEEAYCDQTYETLDFANSIKST